MYSSTSWISVCLLWMALLVSRTGSRFSWSVLWVLQFCCARSDPVASNVGLWQNWRLVQCHQQILDETVSCHLFLDLICCPSLVYGMSSCTQIVLVRREVFQSFFWPAFLLVPRKIIWTLLTWDWLTYSYLGRLWLLSCEVEWWYIGSPLFWIDFYLYNSIKQ